MMSKILTAAVFAGTMALAGAVPVAPVQAAGPPQAADTVTLRVCNNTRVTAQVAISYRPIGAQSFRGAGWFNVQPGQCRDLAETTNAYMYGYAEVEGSDNDVWQGDHSLCVEYPGPYEFWDTDSAYCETWQEARGFVTLHAERTGVYVWNLDG